jgi:hypothetical protein
VKKASVFKFASRFIVCPVSTTTVGVGIDSEPYIVLPASTSAVELGEAINHALDSSHDRVAHPLSWKGLAGPRLAAAGVKSEAEFQKQASLVSLITDGNTITFTPHRNGGTAGPERGFSPIDECAVQTDAKSPEVRVKTAIQIFEHCT